MLGVNCINFLNLGHMSLSCLKRSYSQAVKPLNVLFFGSDQYSSHSLIAVNRLLQSKHVNNLQVVTRSPKPCGRYLSEIREVPIVPVNDSLGLPPVLRCDSKSDLLSLVDNNSLDFNVLIAVSFGKLIPRQLIEKVNGLAFNVHPSLLPRYKGSSPIQYALLNRDEFTGVTIQTLHPTKFDHGEIIKQTEPLPVKELLQLGVTSAFEDDVPKKVAILMDQLGLKSGEILYEMIKNQEFQPMPKPDWKESIAPKITTDMKQIHWENDTKNEIIAKNDALGPLFAYKLSLPKKKKEVLKKRIIFPELIDFNDDIAADYKPGEFFVHEDDNMMIVQCKDGQIGMKNIQFEGFAIETIDTFIRRLSKRCGKVNSNAFI